jgi:uncharacterized protein with von Willebrand factor type A (vWA) domain
MQQVLGDFIHALRQSGLPISSAETLDALNAVQLVGIANEPLLKYTLSLTLVKRLDHQPLFDETFTRYFFSRSDSQADTSTDDTIDPDQPQIIQQGHIQQDHTQQNQTIEQNQTTQQDQESNVGNNNSAPQSQLGQQLMADDQAALQIAIVSAVAQTNAQDMKLFTQIPLITFQIMQSLGDSELAREIETGLNNSNLAESATESISENFALLLQEKRRQLRLQVRDLVEQQYLLFGQNIPKQLREENLQKIKLTSIDHQHYKHMGDLVKKAAKQLASMHSRRQRVTKRGTLNVRKTIAANAAYDGFLFHTKWKSTKVDKPKVMVLCDVSGSVSRVARFLLLFIHCLQDVMPNVRSFVFASELGEVTDLFKSHPMDTAMATIMQNWGNMPTSYGQALTDFKDLGMSDIDNKTTVIMLGDARNNNGNDSVEIWQEVYRKSQKVLWLNPETRSNWNSGDSIMDIYSPYCSKVDVCNSLRDLTRILGNLLKYQ